MEFSNKKKILLGLIAIGGGLFAYSFFKKKKDGRDANDIMKVLDGEPLVTSDAPVVKNMLTPSETQSESDLLKKFGINT